MQFSQNNGKFWTFSSEFKLKICNEAAQVQLDNNNQKEKLRETFPDGDIKAAQELKNPSGHSYTYRRL